MRPARHRPMRSAPSRRRVPPACPRGRCRRGQQAGFSLIEVVVAFALLALGLVLLLGSLSGAARQVRGSGDVSRASLHAQSLWAQAGVGEVLAAGRREGALEGGRYRWTLDVAPWQDPLRPVPGPESPQAPRPMLLTLTVQWGPASGQRLQWRSLRLVPAQGRPDEQVPP